MFKGNKKNKCPSLDFCLIVMDLAFIASQNRHFITQLESKVPDFARNPVRAADTRRITENQNQQWPAIHSIIFSLD